MIIYFSLKFILEQYWIFLKKTYKHNIHMKHTRNTHTKQHKNLHSHSHTKNTQSPPHKKWISKQFLSWKLSYVPHTKISMTYMWWPIIHILKIHINNKKTQIDTHTFTYIYIQTYTTTHPYIHIHLYIDTT
jgi:hypothetical protein